MTAIIFIAILAVLIFSHELGHFLAAKSAGVRVDEFGLGFPPALARWRRGETTYSLNLIPFGGFVKIFGETPDAESLDGPDRARSLIFKSKLVQAWVLVAGVCFNLLLAWVLFAVGFATGLPVSTAEVAGLKASGPAKVLITSVLADSPAEAGGLKAGDEIVGLRVANSRTPETISQKTGTLSVPAVQEFVASHGEMPLIVEYRRGRIFQNPNLPTDELRLVPTALAGKTPVIGVGLDEVVLAQASLPAAVGRGAKLTAILTWTTVRSLVDFASAAFRGDSSLAAVTGPVGLVGLVGDARSLGWIYVLSFTALISINLAVINLVPFPALDGGRLLFLLIEKIKGSPIKPKVANALNLAGFVLLLALMAVVTVHDIWKLVG